MQQFWSWNRSSLLMCMAHTLGMSIQQHQQKSLLKFYVLPRAKTSRFPEKFSEKRLKMPWVKVQVHWFCQNPFWYLFFRLQKLGAKKPGSRWNFWVFRVDIFFGSTRWQAAPIKISAVFLVFSMVSAFWGKVFGACCFILLVAAVQPKKILWDLWNFVRSARFCQRSPLWRLSCFVRFRS